MHIFKAMLRVNGIAAVKNALKKAEIDSRLIELLPVNKRTQENLDEQLKNAGLEQISDFQVSSKAGSWVLEG